MNEADAEVTIVLRIPGSWQSPAQLIEQLPVGFRLTPDALLLPGGSKVEFIPMPTNDQFPEIFASSCRRPPTREELHTVNRYTVNVGLTGAGGSMDAARTMMQAAAAIVRAGGAGVFIDNSALAHGGEQWIAMTEDGSTDALGFAFVGIVRNRQEVWTVGMHVLGLPEIVMRRVDADADEDALINVIRYACCGDKPLGHGHILADERVARFTIVDAENDESSVGSPLYNPFGRLKLVSMKDIADGI